MLQFKKKLVFLFFIFFLARSLFAVNNYKIKSEDLLFILIGSHTCPSCIAVKSQLKAAYPDVKMAFLDISIYGDLFSKVVTQLFPNKYSYSIPLVIIVYKGLPRLVFEGTIGILAIPSLIQTVPDGRILARAWGQGARMLNLRNYNNLILAVKIAYKTLKLKPVILEKFLSTKGNIVTKEVTVTEKEYEGIKQIELNKNNSNGETNISEKQVKSAKITEEVKVGKLNRTEKKNIKNKQEKINTKNIKNKHQLTETTPKISDLVKIALASVLDAVNPCAFSVLLIFLTYVFYNMGGKVLLSGLMFTLSTFIIYYLFGLGIIKIISGVKILKLTIAILALVVGIYEFISEDTPIDEKTKSFVGKLLVSFSGPVAAFLLGGAVGFILLPCTSGPYFVALNIMSKFNSNMRNLLLLLYNLVFVSPFIVITFLVHFGVRTAVFKSFYAKNRKNIIMITSLLLILLALWILGDELL